MLIPSIDLLGGRAVRLKQGRDLVLAVDREPRELAEQFGRVGEVAVIDLDAARGTGDHEALIAELCGLADCRVGGGIRDVAKARRVLAAGARRLIIGTAATPDFLAQLPQSRLLAAVDARDGRVVDHGWTRVTAETPEERARRLEPYVAGFLFTVVERDGMEQGADLDRFRAFRRVVNVPVTVAGGIGAVRDVVALDRDGMDAQVGLALYRGRFTPGDCFAALVDFGQEIGTAPTVVQDARDGRVLIVARSTPETLAESLQRGEVLLHSRQRGRWRTGDGSDNALKLVRVEADCDRDAILMHAVPTGPACHTGSPSCFGARPFSLAQLEWVIRERAATDDASSYTRQLFDDAVTRRSKILEEAHALVDARDAATLRWEAADLAYHALVHLAAEGVSVTQVRAELAARARLTP